MGNYFAYRRNHLEVFRDAYRRFGPAFALQLGPQKMAVLVGQDANRFFFGQVDKILSLPEVYRFVIPMFGAVLNAAEDLDVRRDHLALIHSAFHPKRMASHVDTMVRETELWLDQLGQEGSFELSDSFSGLAMRIAASALMGPEIRGRLDAFIPLFHDLAAGMEFVLPPWLPLPRFRRRDRARRALGDLVAPILAERRANPGMHDDFLQVIVDGSCRKGDDGTPAVGMALLTLFTAYIATAAQMAWSLVQLLQHPQVAAMVCAEIDAVVDDDGLDADKLARLDLLDAALKETQRMHPVMTHFARYNTRGYRFGDYAVPKGWLTVVCPAITHRDPDVFPRPDEYDPGRFAAARGSMAAPYAMIGFGAGLYRCPGAAFGVNEMKTVIASLLSRYRLTLLSPSPEVDFAMGVVRPKPPCRVAYTRR